MPIEAIQAVKCNRCGKLVSQTTGDYYILHGLKLDHMKTSYRNKTSFATTVLNLTEPHVFCSETCLKYKLQEAIDWESK